MDPLSIAGTCISLVGTITKTSIVVTGFVRDVRAARSDLDAVSRELLSLKTVLELLADDVADPNDKPFPETLKKQIAGIVTNCSGVVDEIEQTLKKHEGTGLKKSAQWVTSGKGDMAKLRSSLGAHKSALEIALDMVAMTMAREIKADTQEIRNDTSAIKQDTTLILEEIARLQQQLPQDASRLDTSGFMLQRYLDNLTSYAETVCDTFSDGLQTPSDGGGSPRVAAISSDNDSLRSGRSDPEADVDIPLTKNPAVTEPGPISSGPSLAGSASHKKSLSANQIAGGSAFLEKRPSLKSRTSSPEEELATSSQPSESSRPLNLEKDSTLDEADPGSGTRTGRPQQPSLASEPLLLEGRLRTESSEDASIKPRPRSFSEFASPQPEVFKQPVPRKAVVKNAPSQKTNSIFTLQPVIMSEPSPAMEWANKYDKDAIRAAYLGSTNTGRGLAEATMVTNIHSKSEDALRPAQNMQRVISQERSLPKPPSVEPVSGFLRSPGPPPVSAPPVPTKMNYKHERRIPRGPTKAQPRSHGFQGPKTRVDASMRQSVQPEEVQELLRGCSLELKARALDQPFFLLPFRPTSDESGGRTFIRHFFDQKLAGKALDMEMRLTSVGILSSVVKWCWSRLPGGVVTWEAYELFVVGEQDSNMARDSFSTFIPLSVDSECRSKIIFDFFDLLAATAAHSRQNGLGGRKISRLAAWWAFEPIDSSTGFEGGYKNWQTAADATSHLFFAYLRALSPGPLNNISILPISLQRLSTETEYPPERPTLLDSRANRIVMIVDTVSPTPFALIRRARHFQFRDDDRTLQEFSDYEDPVKVLTDECRRVLEAMSRTGEVLNSKNTTPSWADFLSVGFTDDPEPKPEPNQTLEPGELAMVSLFDLEDTFWWVWITSLAPEETPERKAAFGCCALLETVIPGGRWMVIEEMVKGAPLVPDTGDRAVKKKGLWGRLRGK